MSKMLQRLLPLLLAFVFFASAVRAQQPDHPPGLNLGDAVVSGFSGTLTPDPAQPRPANKSVIDLTFINPDGPSARIIGLGQPGYVWDGRLFQAPKTFDVFAKDVGQVFGITLDDAIPPNIYLAATSAFGLQIVGRGRDGLPERRKKGAPGAGWMKGQFGLDLQGGPGSIYKVDGRTGAVTLFANVTLDGVPNPGPGLGNLAYDSAHKQLFVSDLYTGMIHRFALDGRDLGPPHDFGVTARPTMGNLPAQPFNPGARLNIAVDRFDSENPNTWGLAPPARRVWGLAVHEGRLYYSARNGAPTNGPQIWSVGIQQDGNFAADVRWELDVADVLGPYSVSDIAFSQKGAMILAQRAPIAASYDYSAFTQPGEPRVLRYWLEQPDDPKTPSRWIAVPEEYAIGYAEKYRNSNGGVALGYGYDQNGMLSATGCEAALWSTGQNLRNNPALRSQLEPGGPLLVHGLQGNPVDMVRGANEPPATSYYVDYDDTFDDPRATGHMGSVRILAQPCAGAVAGAGGTSSPPYVSGPQSGGGNDGGCVGPNCRPINLAIKKTAGTVTFDEKTGLWTIQFTLDVTNAGNPFAPGNSISISDPVPAGMTLISATGTNWNCGPPPPPPLSSGSVSCGYNFGPGIFNTAAQLNQLVLTFTTKTPGKYTNCATVGTAPGSGFNETTLADNRSCDTVEIKPRPIDVAIAKTGVIVQTPDLPPPGFSNLTFTLAMTNMGAAFTGANVITVTDVVPAGMTFNGASGAGWNCGPASQFPLAAGSTLTCTYTGTGPVAPGAPLGTITINAFSSSNGPWTNCADVAIAATAGVDSNLTDNHSCVTLTNGFIPVVPPPEIKPSCGMDVLFVVDESRSIADANATYNVTSALTTAAGILNTNGSKAALVRFSDNATVVYNWSTATYSTLNTGYNPAAGGGTNWEAAMVKAMTLLPHPNSIIIFITDGVPTAYLDNSGAVQYTTNSVLATNEAIPVVNSIYGLGVPIIGIGIGGISTHLNALLGGNVHSTTYGGLGDVVQDIARKLCPKLYLTKQISPNYINYFYSPPPQQVTVTLKLTNTTGATVNAEVQDALPPELTSPNTFVASLGSAGGNPVIWTIPGLINGATATLTFKATVSPSTPPPTDTSWKCYKNFSQVTKVNGVAEDSTHLMANPVTGPVHEQDEASDQVCVQKHEYTGGGDCGDSYLWVTKKTAFPEICVPGGSPACTFNITVTARCKAFNGPVLFGDGVFSGSTVVSPTITSITNNASPSICAWSGGWSSTTAPSYCLATISLPLNQSITFTVTLGPPLPPLAAGAKYTNCFVADGKTPVPANFPAAYTDVNPNTDPNGGKWGNCTPFNVPSQVMLVCPSGTVQQMRGGRRECVPPVVCAPPLVPGPVAGQCICPPGTTQRGRECVKQTTCQPPMVPGPVAGVCICPPGTVQKGRECVRQITCNAPMVPNAAGRECICPPGTVQKGLECIRQIKCNAPMVPNAAGRECICPQGTVQKGRECVRPTVCIPPAKLNRRGACECPANMVARGNSCIAQPRVTPRDNPAGPRGGSQGGTPGAR